MCCQRAPKQHLRTIDVASDQGCKVLNRTCFKLPPSLHISWILYHHVEKRRTNVNCAWPYILQFRSGFPTRFSFEVLARVWIQKPSSSKGLSSHEWNKIFFKVYSLLNQTFEVGQCGSLLHIENFSKLLFSTIPLTFLSCTRGRNIELRLQDVVRYSWVGKIFICHKYKVWRRSIEKRIFQNVS